MAKKVFEKATQEVHNLAVEVMRQYHTSLYDLEVKVAITMVSKFDSDDELIPCLKLHGAHALAIVHLTKTSDRVYLNHDAEIMIDAFNWKDASIEFQKSLLDHELEHLVVVKDRKGIVKTDDFGRPKLRMIPDDFTLTGFYAIIRRHGDKATEYNSVAQVYTLTTEALAEHNRAQAEHNLDTHVPTINQHVTITQPQPLQPTAPVN